MSFNLGHALPLPQGRFWCYAGLRMNLRECCAIYDDHAAIRVAFNATRICEPSCQPWRFNFAVQCCVSAARAAALNDSRPLPSL